MSDRVTSQDEEWVDYAMRWEQEGNPRTFNFDGFHWMAIYENDEPVFVRVGEPRSDISYYDSMSFGAQKQARMKKK